MKWYPRKRFSLSKTEADRVRRDLDGVMDRMDKYIDKIIPTAECETCGCLMRKETAHEVAKMKWRHDRCEGRKNLPKDAVVTSDHYVFMVGIFYEYKVPTTMRKYYCKIHKPEEPKPKKKRKK